MKTKKEWYRLAVKAGNTLYAHEEKTFKGATDVMYFSLEVTRYDDFTGIRVHISTKSYNHGEAEAISDAIGHYSASINLNDYTEEGDLDKFVADTMEQITAYRQKVDEFRKTYQQNQ